MPYKDPERKRQWYLTRRTERKAKGLCVVCGTSKSVTTRCFECRQKRKEKYDTEIRHAEQLSNAELYKRVRSEREVVSWAWKHPA